MAAHSPGDITGLLAELHRGNRDVEAKLIRLVYDELRRLAGSTMRNERPDHTLQATVVVHDALMKLSQQKSAGFQNRDHFFATARHAMREILIDYARGHGRQKRGGGREKVPLQGGPLLTKERSEELVQLAPALERLRGEHPRQAEMVELRFFCGLSTEEIAKLQGVSPKTVKRDWTMARAWLYGEIRPEAGP